MKVLLLVVALSAVTSAFNPFAKPPPKQQKIDNNPFVNPFANSNNPFANKRNNDLFLELDNNPKPKTKLPKKEKNIDTNSKVEQSRKKAFAKLQGITSIAEFLKKFPKKEGVNAHVTYDKEGKASFLVQSRSLQSVSGGETVITEQLAIPEHAGCTPRPKTRDVSHLSNHSGIIYPSCISYNQCGGCCQNKEYRKCVPDTVQETRVRLFRINLHYGSWEPVTFSYHEHKSCRCDCKVKPEDCVGAQYHSPSDCQCHCPFDAKKKCPEHKQWSAFYCDCVCSNTHPWCESGKKWNKQTCGCECIKERDVCPFGRIWDDASCMCASPFG